MVRNPHPTSDIGLNGVITRYMQLCIVKNIVDNVQWIRHKQKSKVLQKLYSAKFKKRTTLEMSNMTEKQ